VVVTGAGAGIGRGIALAFAACGDRVLCVDVDASAAQDVAKAIEAEGGTAVAVAADLREPAESRRIVDEAVARFGGLDVLVNNAGVTMPGDLLSTTEEGWDAIHSINLRGAFFCMQAAARRMKEQGSGRIINLASISGKGYKSTIAYSASKGGVVAMSRVAAQELGPFGVTVNSIAPGFTAGTAVMQRAIEATAQKLGQPVEAVAAQIASVTSTRRFVEIDEVAATAVFLASPAAASITGQSINVDGGLVFD
jgi:NAD(P)-dependent dehydrogenase (short-subunit alcohol dehydrogenase family)